MTLQERYDTHQKGLIALSASLEMLSLLGPYSDGGVPVARMAIGDDFRIDVAPERGGDIIALQNLQGRPGASCPLGVVSAGNARSLVSLTDRLKTLAHGFTAMGHVGAPCQYHPLHGSWTHTPMEIVNGDSSENEAYVEMAGRYRELCTAALVGVEFDVERSIRVLTTDYGAPGYILLDCVTMTRPGYPQYLHHPNEPMYLGDRLVLPWNDVSYWSARDGETPVNPFTPARDVGQLADEQCYFGQLKAVRHTNEMLAFPSLILGEDGLGVGRVFVTEADSYDPARSNFVYWRNPSYGWQAPEFGDLPKGREYAIEHDLLRLYEKGEMLYWGYEDWRLNTPEHVSAFCQDWDMDPEAPVPDHLAGEIQGWDGKALPAP